MTVVTTVGKSCIKCGNVEIIQHLIRYHRYLCKECYSKWQTDRDRRNWAQKLVMSARWSSKRSSRGTVREVPRDFSITKEDVIAQGERQGWICFWWGIPMDITNREPLNYRKVSLDRLDSSGGYVPDNIVLCTEAANKCKSKMTAAEFLRLQEDISKHYHNAPCHTLLSDPPRILPTPPESEPPPDPLTGDQS